LSRRDRLLLSVKKVARRLSLPKTASAISLLFLAALAPTPIHDQKPRSDRGRCVALTFDDGPDIILTPRLLTILERENVRATFFVVGQRVAAIPDVLRREQNDGDEIGNHTWDHRLLPALTDEDVVNEIARTDTAVVAVTGRRPDLIRPPYGIIDGHVEDVLRDRGLLRPVAMWDIDTFDWLRDDVAGMVRATSRVGLGSVVLMHDVHPGTVVAIPEIIRRLRARGFRFTTFTDLAACLNEVPSEQGNRRLAAHDLASELRGKPIAAPEITGGRLIGLLFGWRRSIVQNLFN
jgi:peptidoglycan/xylan/chitin deacetylase (PgdA/CDA1 family)